MQPTPFGRTIAGLFGLALGGCFAYLLTKDYQLIKFEEYQTEEERARHKKLQVRFREMQPLELKQDVKKKRIKALKLESEEQNSPENN
ncbi:hypothetical protein WICMUC_003553 [Wickerhamomyces mucosus]|uniref:Uncharacterized protein n=1 Tax=Wickerhamomyces mucosus TaxID=1378264 RepID=A0A9P8PLD9_9ASCO|nr:hypothetical protein WICMUC_003553 [Wickerhamomyces mucosus]